MNKYLVYIASILLMAGAFASCDEVEEVNAYSNWQMRNEAYADSIHALAADNLVPLISDKTEGGMAVEDIPENVLFGIETIASSTAGKQYIYCKKITCNNAGKRPVSTSSVSSYYYGTNILGLSFDGNFQGYGALDTQVLNATDKCPTPFDSPAEFKVNQLITGWTTALQYMHEGERWMLYIPHQSAYGASNQDALIPAFSTLVFDLQLNEVK